MPAEEAEVIDPGDHVVDLRPLTPTEDEQLEAELDAATVPSARPPQGWAEQGGASLDSGQPTLLDRERHVELRFSALSPHGPASACTCRRLQTVRIRRRQGRWRLELHRFVLLNRNLQLAETGGGQAAPAPLNHQRGGFWSDG
jgi:hypothetical protein